MLDPFEPSNPPLNGESEEELRRQASEDRAERLLASLPDSREARITALAKRLDVFSAAALRIRTKDGGPLWRFVLNPIQQDYLDSLRSRYAPEPGLDRFRGIRDLIVKPRQLGFSTLIAALYFMDAYFEQGRISVVLTHKADLSQELLRTYRTFLEGLPKTLRDSVRAVSDSKYHLELEFLNGDPADPPSRFVIGTEAGEPWRGGVIHNLHASEAAWYKDWAAFMASYVQAVPQTGNIAFETTANGCNPFYQAVQDAEHGVSDYRVVFYEWFKHPEYRRAWDPARQEPVTPEEQALLTAQGLSLEQLAWRRWKQSELRGLFLQEYPETLLGAFRTTGRPVFDPDAVDRGMEWAKKAPPPQEPRDFVKIYEPHIPGELYLLSADVAEGLDRGSGNASNPELGGTDYSAAYVFHVRTLRVVASVHGRIAPAPFARILDQLGRKYEATVAVERNNHGHTVLAALEEARYPELYRHVEYNQSTGQRAYAPGFPTTSVTRPLTIDALDEAIRRGGLHIPDPRFWNEAHAFHRNERGRPEALPGNHDDRIIAAGIGVYLCTLGRSAWGVEGVDGADGAGFPRYRVEEVPLEELQQASRGEASAEGDPWGGGVPHSPMDHIRDYLVHSRRRGHACSGCAEFKPGPGSGPSPGPGRCKVLNCWTQPTDPVCEHYYPLSEAEEDVGSGFSSQEPWNVTWRVS